MPIKPFHSPLEKKGAIFAKINKVFFLLFFFDLLEMATFYLYNVYNFSQTVRKFDTFYFHRKNISRRYSLIVVKFISIFATLP